MSRWIPDRIKQYFAERTKSRADDRKWASARTVDDIGELTAQWLEGRVGFHPGGYDDPDPETLSLAKPLAVLNRSGYATTGSQPGLGPVKGYDNNWWWQRAAVDGFARPDVVDKLEDAARSNGLYVSRHNKATLFSSWRDGVAASKVSPYKWHEPIEGRSVTTTTGFGGRRSYSAIELEFRSYEKAQIGLYRTPQLTIVDPKWGRNDLLWSALSGVDADQEMHNQYVNDTLDTLRNHREELQPERERIEIDHRSSDASDRLDGWDLGTNTDDLGREG